VFGEKFDMLRETLAFAREEISWYGGDRYNIALNEPGDLARLPIVTPADMLADPAAFSSSDEWPVGVSYSSSTTGRVGRPRWHSAGELTAIGALAKAEDVLPAWDEVALVIHPYDQGPTLSPPGRWNTIYAALFVPWHYEHVLDLLRSGWRRPGGVARISLLDASNPVLRVLTCWFESRGVDPRSFGIRHLEGYGSLQATNWRDRLVRSWGASYQDLFGLSEVKMSTARECPVCNAYHFLLPIVAEIVDPMTRQPVTDGTGVLVLSELLPYAQLQVLLRYWTADLVEVAGRCVTFGSGFYPLGRRSTSAVIERPGRRPLVVGDLQVAEVCAELADVALAEIAWAPWARDAGAPLCRIEAEGRRVVVTVGLRYAIDLFRKRTEEVQAAVRDRLLANVSGLVEGIELGEVELEIRAADACDIEAP
jgi:hypothetical protein